MILAICVYMLLGIIYAAYLWCIELLPDSMVGRLAVLLVLLIAWPLILSDQIINARS